jgi:hypothetical protein
MAFVMKQDETARPLNLLMFCPYVIVPEFRRTKGVPALIRQFGKLGAFSIRHGFK